MQPPVHQQLQYKYVRAQKPNDSLAKKHSDRPDYLDDDNTVHDCPKRQMNSKKRW